MAAAEASTPPGATRAVPESSIRQTPPSPATAPSRCVGRGRSDSSGQAISIMASGEVAITVEARLVGRSWAATYTSAKKPPMLRTPSTSAFHHHEPRGSVRHRASRTSPAGSALNAAP